MTENHSFPITPPPELVQQWFQEWNCDSIEEEDSDIYVATRAAQWGADQELEACCALMDEWGLCGEDLMQCRRPKPPSLKEQALEALSEMEDECLMVTYAATIRRALESIPDPS
jgi:hypothetical protein